MYSLCLLIVGSGVFYLALALTLALALALALALSLSLANPLGVLCVGALSHVESRSLLLGKNSKRNQ